MAPGWNAVIWLSSRSVVMKACAVSSLSVRAKVGTHRRHRHPVIAEKREVVGDVARAAAVLAAHLRHEERHVQDMDLVGQDVIGEAIAEHHDGVESERATDQRTPGPGRGRAHVAAPFAGAAVGALSAYSSATALFPRSVRPAPWR